MFKSMVVSFMCQHENLFNLQFLEFNLNLEEYCTLIAFTNLHNKTLIQFKYCDLQNVPIEFPSISFISKFKLLSVQNLKYYFLSSFSF